MESKDQVTPAVSVPGEVPPRGAPRITAEQLISLPESERKNNWINSLVQAEVARQNYAYDRQLARDFALSGQFDDIKGTTQEQAVAAAIVKIQIGRDLGLTPTDSMQNVYFTNGRPAIQNEIVAMKLQQAGYAWDTEFETEPITFKNKSYERCIGVKLWLKRYDPEARCYTPVVDRNGNQICESFGELDAAQAKIWEKGKQISLLEKWNFQAWPREMFYWRTIGRLRKFHAPHVLRGAVTYEERLDVLPGDAPPDLVPPDLQQLNAAEEPSAPRKTRKQRLMEQEALSETPAEPQPSPEPSKEESQ